MKRVAEKEEQVVAHLQLRLFGREDDMLHAPTNDFKKQGESTRKYPAPNTHSLCRTFDGSHALGMPRVAARIPPPSMPAAARKQHMARLQRAYGNQAVLRMLERSQPAIQPKLVVNEPGDAYEQEADRVAEQVMRMPDPDLSIAPRQIHGVVAGFAPRAMRLDVASTGTDQPSAGLADDPYCLQLQPGGGPERCQFTDRQQHTLSAMQFAARSLTATALMNLRRGDPYMATLAAQIFHVVSPDMSDIADTTSAILEELRSIPIVCGTCADENCYPADVLAYTTDDLSTIVLCQPRFFRTSVTQMRRTIVHEAGHAAGIGSSNVGLEHYCPETSAGCDDPCSTLPGDLRQNVDAWAHFIECAAFSG